MKIEVVMDASSVPGPTAAKSLADRVAANPKAQPKSATAVKKDTKDGAKGRAGKPGNKKRARTARPKAKTAEELDAEMTDYWGGNNPSAVGAPTEAVATNGTTAPAVTTGDDAMDEIS
jgi:THO complex subunit 4